MTCEHLKPLEDALIALGVEETFRGKAWSKNCREWVYFDCFIDTKAVAASLKLADCVSEHVHRGTHDGQERGFICKACNDGIMGHYERSSKSRKAVGIYC